MKTSLNLASILLMAAVYFSSASAQNAKGWYEENCDGATFHFTKIAGTSNDLRLELFFRSRLPFSLLPTSSDWRDVENLCPDTGRCEDSAGAVSAKMQFQGRTKRTVSGQYSIDLRGRHLEGQFSAKQRFLKHPSRICE